MDEVNVVIQSVLPVQQSLPPQKKRARSTIKNEDSSFDRTMRMENKTAANGENETRRSTKREKRLYSF